MAKPILHCIKINDLFDTLIETNTFDVKAAEEIAGGTHYVRSSRVNTVYNVNTVRGVTKTKIECVFGKKTGCCQILCH